MLFSGMLIAQVSETDSTGLTRYFYGEGIVASEGYLVDGKPDGYWTSWYVNGIKKSEGNRRNHLLDSVWIFYDHLGDTLEVINYFFGKKNGYYSTWEYWYEKSGNDSTKHGAIISKYLYLNDKKEGASLFYHRNGALHKSIYYKDNKKHGQGKEFAEDGRIITLLEYHNDYQTNKERINRYDRSGKKSGKWKEFYPTGRVHIDASYYQDSLNGYYREYDNQGSIIKLLLYENGKIIDDNPEVVNDSLGIEIRNEYYPNGSIKHSGSYTPEGVKIGIHREYNEKEEIINAWFFNEDGMLIGMGIIDDEGRKQGKWIYYYDNGELMSEGKYKNDLRINKWLFLFEDGKVEQKGKYRKGKPNGEWIWYYKNGQVRRDENYVKGREEGPYLELYNNGDTIVKGEYFDGEKHGSWYSRVGDLTEKGSYLDGEKDGLWQHFYPSGKLNFKGNFVQGFAHGKHKYYYENGKVKFEINYLMGSKEGKWIEYDELGVTKLFIVYKNDFEYKINGLKFKLPKDEEEEED